MGDSSRVRIWPLGSGHCNARRLGFLGNRYLDSREIPTCSTSRSSGLRDIIRFSRSLFGSKLITYIKVNVDNAAVSTLGEGSMGL